MSVEHEFSEPVVHSIHPVAIYEHRYGQFASMGFEPADAKLLANTRQDIHAVRRMLTQGCPVALAVRILL